MLNKINVLGVKFAIKKDNLKNKFTENINYINNDKGNVISTVIFAGIVVLAVVALLPTVRTTFTNFGTDFSNFVKTKASEVFGS